MEYQNLVGKYLNGYKIVKVANDPFVKNQINLWTNEETTEAFGDRSIVKFFIREEANTAKIYQELIDKEVHSLKQALNEIKEYIKDKQKIQYKFALSQIECDEILEKIDKVLGEEKC